MIFRRRPTVRILTTSLIQVHRGVSLSSWVPHCNDNDHAETWVGPHSEVGSVTRLHLVWQVEFAAVIPQPAYISFPVDSGRLVESTHTASHATPATETRRHALPEKHLPRTRNEGRISNTHACCPTEDAKASPRARNPSPRSPCLPPCRSKRPCRLPLTEPAERGRGFDAHLVEQGARG